ncbi:MAG TPA: NAD(P)-dependent oxidoreductase [Acidimicrobiales bacterium]|nr:NAD(P)-dependent oxidoreductase [Acidimicrobiales bacterium]
MRVLVTGAGGFIGAPTTAELHRAGHEVAAILRTGATASRRSIPEGVRFVHADLGDPSEVEAALEATRPEAVLHLAWYADPADYLRAPWANLASLEHTLGLLRRLRDAGCRRVVLGGSCLEHADGPAAASPYATAKRAAHAVAAALPADEMAVACAHVFWVYGPGENPRRGVPTVTRGLLRGDTVDVTAGTQLREYVHVADVASALRLILESTVMGRVDITTGHPVPLRRVFEQLQEEVGNGTLRFGARASGPDDTFEVPGEPEPLRSLGWTPGHDLATGVADTVRWWRQELATGTVRP